MKRRLLAVGAVLGALLFAYGMASADRCGAWPPAAPSVVGEGRADGELRAGAASLPLEPVYPVTVGGYGPWRSTAGSARMPVMARAVVLSVGQLRVGIVTLDVLFVPDALAMEIRARTRALGLSEVWVVGTHTHSSFGQYDARSLVALVGTGRFRPDVAKMLVDGAFAALAQATDALVPARVEVGEGNASNLVRPRSGERVDARLTRVRFVGTERGLAQLVLFSAHPTLAPRRTEQLDPDYPGALAQARAAEDGVTLFLPASVGNATAVNDNDGPPERAPNTFAERLAAELPSTTPGDPEARTLLSFARVAVPLPHPDASRAVSPALWGIADNLYCRALPRAAEVSALRIGSLELVGLPGEPTADAARTLEEATGAERVVGLTHGYVGYIETPDLLQSGRGEGRRQYYVPTLLSVLTSAARVALDRARR